MGPPQGDPSAVIRSRVQAARRLQSERWGSSATNASVGAGRFESKVALTSDARLKLGEAIDGLALTGRGVDRLLRVARTLADLSGDSKVTAKHMGHALGFRLQVGDLVVAA
jgi:magnesium chelatase family protein